MIRFVVATLIVLAGLFRFAPVTRAELPSTGLFSRTNLVAWCIVPFDTQKRTPAQRAAMLESLGISRLAYDWRNEHIPTFDDEVAEMARHRVELTAWWFPANLGPEARAILDCLQRHKLHPQLWVTMGTEPEPDPAKLEARIAEAVKTLGPICAEAARIGSTVGLYNHLGWFGEPTNQLVILEKLRAAGQANAGMVYNFHHGHAHIDQFSEILTAIKPHLLAINLNGMVYEGDRQGRKIIPLGTGDEELAMLQLLQRSGWRGPVGILGHTEEDAEGKLRKELAGLEKLVPLLDGPTPPRPARPARQVQLASSNPSRGLSEKAIASESIVPGKFAKALDARVRGIVTAGKPGLRSAPFSVEAWVRLGSSEGFNIIAASESKSSASHWELYSYSGTGTLSFYQPGAVPQEIRSEARICDAQWHHVGANVLPDEVVLCVDGREVARQSIRRTAQADGAPAQFAIGRLVEGGLGCDGWIESIRVSRGPRVMEQTARAALFGDSGALAYWAFESANDLDGAAALAATVPPDGGSKPIADSPQPAASVNRSEPWKQQEPDWVDDRRNRTIPARWQSYYLPTSFGTVRKGFAVRLGEASDAAVAYDTATGNWRLAWTGGFLKWDAARFALINPPKPGGPVDFTVSDKLGWHGGEFQWHGFATQGERVALQYSVGGVLVRESPWAAKVGDNMIYSRDLEIGRTDTKVLGLELLSGAPEAEAEGDVNRSPWFGFKDGTDLRAILLDLQPGLSVTRPGLSNIVLSIEPHDRPMKMRLLYFHGPESRVSDILASVRQIGRFPNFSQIFTNGAAQTLPAIKVQGQLGPASEAYAIDTIPVPYENPANALMFCSGVGFFDNGDAAVSTIHGDVWRVSGLDEKLQNVQWRRIATGLYQPLGLTVVSNQPVVLCRDHLTRLIDLNGDGVTDYYESLCSQVETSGGGHDYVTSLCRDDSGNFYYVDPRGAHRVSPDGKRYETIARGFRNANGMGVSPDGKVILVSPQQGEWTPSSVIHEIKQDGWYGYPGAKVTPERPLGYDLPLCWIPHRVDNSSGSQVWAVSDRFGPLSNQILHFSWGRCSLFLTLRDVVDGVAQGAVVPLKGRFLSGAMRGAINPKDGQFYVVGCQGWQTAAARDGSFQRFRWTGRKLALPVAWKALPGALQLTFNEPLDRETVIDPGSYSVEAWNYRYAQQYGSKDWSVANPGKEGHDVWTVKSAELGADGKTVTLRIPEVKPVMQFAVKFNLDTAARGSASGEVYGTIHRLHASQ